MRYANPQLVDQLASSYVLGTLAPGARRRFERLRRERPDVNLAVSQWESRLGALARSIDPVEPSPAVWRAIEARTRPPAVPSREASGRWFKPASWGVGGLIAGMALSYFAVLLAPALFITTDQVAMRAGEKLPQAYVGLLADANGEGKLLASSLRHGRTMTFKVIGPIAPPAAGKLVLWALPSDAPPFVLGVVPASGSAQARLPDTSEKLLSKVPRLLVTQETVDRPAAPSALVVLRGNCAKVW
jgi:anti-sigma-K factor RskA